MTLSNYILEKKRTEKKKKVLAPRKSQIVSRNKCTIIILKNGERQSLSPNNTQSEMLKALEITFHDMHFHFFQQLYQHQSIMSYWKHSKVYNYKKKDDPILLTNYMPITLANILHKLYASTLLANYGKKKHKPQSKLAETQFK